MTDLVPPPARSRIEDFPELLAPQAVSEPIFVYLMSCGNAVACRERRSPDFDDDLILVLSPRSTHPRTRARSYLCPPPLPQPQPLPS